LQHRKKDRITKRIKIAYLLDLFPVLSETFIVREILELKKNGFEILLFARENTKGKTFSEIVHNDSMILMKDVYYFYSLRKKWKNLQLGIYHLYFLVLHPIKYLKTFIFSFRQGNKIFKIFKSSVLYAIKLKRYKVNHIHVHFALNSCTYAMIISMYTDIPYSFTIHAHDIFISELSELLEEKFYRSKFAVSISEYNKRYILKFYPAIDPQKIKIVHCGIDIKQLCHEDRKLNNTFDILAIGRLVEQKGFEYLIQACRILKQLQKFNFQCKIIGEGKERPKLERLISEYGLTQTVYLLGSKEQSEVLRTMKNTHLFVLPCVAEESGAMDGIPVALMEAMALEIPVISTMISGIPELVKNNAGILVAPKDAEALAMAIGKIAKLKTKQRVDMGSKARMIVAKQFNLEYEVKKLAKLF